MVANDGFIDPKAFLDDVFQAITYKSYLPGAQPPPKPDFQNQPPSQNASPESSRKRRFDEASLPDDRDHNGPPGGRSFKQPRRGRRGGREDRGDRNGNAYPMMMMPPFDPNNPMEAIMQMQAMGLPWPGMPGQQGWGFGGGPGGSGGRGGQKRRGRCRDFDTKGFCARGSTCVYDHGNGDTRDGEFINIPKRPSTPVTKLDTMVANSFCRI